MEQHITSKLEEYYQKFVDLQEKLKKSEEQRYVLEMKFNEMVEVAKEEEQAHYRKLRTQYKRFLEEDKKRQVRNERIIRNLERIETRFTTLSAKTQRIDILRRQYHNFLARITSSQAQPEQSLVKEEPLKKAASVIFEHDKGKAMKLDTTLLPSSSSIKKVAEMSQSNEEKIEILDKYLQSVSSQRCRDLLNQEKEAKEKLAFDTRSGNFSESDGPQTNHASAIADDIMNSIYSRYYSKNDGLALKLKDVKGNVANESEAKKNDDENIKRDATNCMIKSNSTHETGYNDFINEVDLEAAQEKNSLLQTQGSKTSSERPKVSKQHLSNQYGEKKLTEPQFGVCEQLSNEQQPIKDGNYDANLIENKYNQKLQPIQNQQDGKIDYKECHKNGLPVKYQQAHEELKKETTNDSNQHPTLYDQTNAHQANYTPNQPSMQIPDQNKLTEHTNYDQNQQFSQLQYSENEQATIYDQTNVDQTNYPSSPPFMQIPNQNKLAEHAKYDENQQLSQLQCNENEQPTNYDQNNLNEYPSQMPDQSKMTEQMKYYPDQQPSQIQNNENVLTTNYDQTNEQQNPRSLHIQEENKLSEQENYDQQIHYDEGNEQHYDQSQSHPEMHYDEKNEPINYDQNTILEHQSNYDQSDCRSTIQNDENQAQHTDPQEQYDENGQPINYDQSYNQNQLQGQNQYSPVEIQYDENGQPINYDQGENDQTHYDESGQAITYDQNKLQVEYDRHNENYEQQAEYNESHHFTTNETNENNQLAEENAKYDQNYQASESYDGQVYDQNPPTQSQYDESVHYDQSNEYPTKNVLDQTINREQENNAQMANYDQYEQPIFYDQHGQVVQPQYDEHGQLIQQYDENGQLVVLYDQNGQPYDQPQYYDENGQPVYSYQEYPEGHYDEEKQDGNEELKQEANKEKEQSKVGNVMDILDTDTESSKQNISKVSNDTDFDFS